MYGLGSKTLCLALELRFSQQGARVSRRGGKRCRPRVTPSALHPERMAGIPGFGIDRVAAAVGSDPEVLRLENLDTDLLPAQEALRATREAVGQAEANS
jgi:hypothetical protein